MADWPSGNGYTVLASAARTATVSSAAVVGENHRGAHVIITAAANTAVSDVLPARWRVTMTAADAKSVTYSVVANLLQ